MTTIKNKEELIEDLELATDLFCESYYDPYIDGCTKCPLTVYECSDCRVNYVQYILRIHEQKNKKTIEENK